MNNKEHIYRTTRAFKLSHEKNTTRKGWYSNACFPTVSNGSLIAVGGRWKPLEMKPLAAVGSHWKISCISTEPATCFHYVFPKPFLHLQFTISQPPIPLPPPTNGRRQPPTSSRSISSPSPPSYLSKSGNFSKPKI